jgi:hydroxyethylthiazole kinase-like uncharacterized protein yjeF
MGYEILSSDQMREADRLAIESGTPGFTLMENAGKAAANVILKRFKRGQALILCGPGNNGGDGFVIATRLKRAGWKVRVACMVHLADLQGDAAQAAAQWKGSVEKFDALEIHPKDIVIDAVFGTGFDRHLQEPVASLFQTVLAGKNTVVAIDIPSGVNGTSGKVDENTLPADITITFCRKKTGHILEPGKSAAGEIVVCDIGIKSYIVEQTNAIVFENHPDIWSRVFPMREADKHKYDFGHAVIFGAQSMTGATRLASESCARVGAGLTTVLAEGESSFIYRMTLPPHIIVEDREENIYRNLEDERRNAVLIGPGAGKDHAKLREIVTTVCELKRKTVLDADALNALAAEPKSMSLLHSSCVLTPHEGEFKKLFPDITGTKLEKAKEAARRARCVIVLKGSDTIIAAPDGRAAINTNGTPNLATAGTGDVLAGMIAGLLAQGMPEFEGACAAVWIHGECARRVGPGLVASDIQPKIAQIIRDLVI